VQNSQSVVSRIVYISVGEIQVGGEGVDKWLENTDGITIANFSENSYTVCYHIQMAIRFRKLPYV